jgi:hypothetical protein
MQLRRFLWPRSLGGKAFVLFCAFVLVVAVTYQFAVWSLTRQLEALLEADRAKGLPTTIAEAYGPPIPESENAEGPLLAAAAIAEKIHRQALKEAFGSETPDPWKTSYRDPKYLAAFGRLAESSPEFAKQMAEAQRRPRFMFSSRPEDCRVPVRQFANLFSHALRAEAARALIEANSGQRDAAMERLIRLYRFSRLGYEAAPFFHWWNIVNNIIRGDVHWAIDRVLVSGSVSDRVRGELDESLTLAGDNLRSAALAHQGTKLFLINGYQEYERGAWTLSAWHHLPPVDIRNRTEIAGIMARSSPQIHRSGRSALTANHEFRKEMWSASKAPIYRALLYPAFAVTVNEASASYIPFREIAHARCLRVLNALQRYKTAEVAKLGLPPSATIDPFTEEPLKIIKTKSGWVVYSLGENQKELAPDEIAKGQYVVGNVDELAKATK